jgi:hypothetical protein
MPPAMPSVLLGWSLKVGSKRVVPTKENLDALSWSQQITCLTTYQLVGR